MSELTINNLIKIIIGITVVIVVVVGVYFLFKGDILESLKNMFSLVK